MHALPLATPPLAPAFRPYFWSVTLADAGMSVRIFAVPLIALGLLGASPFQVGLLTAVAYLPAALFGLSAGVLADRVSRPRLMLIRALGCAACLAAMPLAQATGHLELSLLLFLALLLGAFELVGGVAQGALLSELAPGSNALLRANSKISGAGAVVNLVGPGVAGGLIQWVGAPFALLADACCYLLSGGFARRLPAERRVHRASPVRRPAMRDTAWGLKLLWQQPLRALVGIYLAWVCAEYFCLSLRVIDAVQVLGVSAGAIGLAYAATGAGGLAAAWLAGRLAPRAVDGWLGPSMAIAFSGFMLLALLRPDTPGVAGWYVASLAVGAVGITQFSILFRTRFLQACPTDSAGRCLGALRFLESWVLPLTSLAAGACAQLIGIAPAIAAAAGVGLAISLYVAARAWRRTLSAPEIAGGFQRFERGG